MKITNTFAALLALLSGTAYAGGIEHFCNGTTEVIEAWTVPTGIPWAVHTGAVGTITCPGYAPNGCAAQLTGDVTQWPAIQSLSAAAAAWGSAGIAGFSTPATTFSLAPTPTLFPVANWTLLANSQLIFLVGPDGMNLMTCWEPASSFSFIGGPFTIAVSQVGVNLSTGVITESDIAFNVRSESVLFSGIPFWSFLETSTLFGLEFGSKTGDPFAMPTLGFADLQGVATHEIGHLAGLGHTMIESSAASTVSRFPCMFPVAQGEPFTRLLTVPNGGCSPSTWTPTSVAGTVLGKSARTLRRDDVCAIADAYPTGSYLTNLGTISGVVSLFGSPVLAANVVAIAKRSPDVFRTSTLSFTGGAYSLRGLVPGDYYVYVEPIDQNPVFPGGNNGRYFSQNDVPNFAFLGASGCITSPVLFETEFWDTAESGTETSPSNATLIVASAGQTVTRSFDVELDSDVLRVRNSTSASTYMSPRGLQMIGTAGVYPIVELQVAAGPTWAGASVSIFFDNKRQARQLGPQLSQVNIGTAAGVPATITGVADANGNFSTTVALTSAAAFQTLFAQSRLVKSGSSMLTNVPVIWVTN